MLKKFLIGTMALALMLVVASSASAFSGATLKVGSRGADVMELQTLVGATVDGSFGPMTKAAVMAWQANNGLVADGIFGKMSMAKAAGTTPVTPGETPGATCPNGMTVASSCTVAPAGATGPLCPNGMTVASNCGANSGTGTLTGGAGTISTVETTTDVENYIVEGQEDEKILGFKVTATDSDAKVTNLKITLTHSVSGSTYLDRYVSDVSVWMNGTKVATIEASEFTKDSSGVYSKSISLANAVVKSGTSNKATFYVTASGLSNIDTGDMAAKWNVAVSDFRYQDGTGVIMTHTPSPVIDHLVDVEDISGVGDVKLVITKDSTSPTVGNVKISDTGSTSGVKLLAFKAKNTGADMAFDAMSIDVTSTTNPVAMIGELTLKADGASIATWTPTSTATGLQTAVFDLDDTYTLEKDTTTLFTVEAKINDIDNFVAGTVVASYNVATAYEVVSTRTALVESGAAAGEIQTFFANGLVASAFTYGTPVVVTNTSGTTTSATYAITFKVTASGASYYVDKSGGLVATANGGATATFSDLSATGATSNTNSWLVSDGDTATFTTTGVIGSAASGFAKIPLATLAYGVSDTALTSSYTFSPASSFETSSTYFTD